MKSLCWLTDVHLNFLDKERRKKLYQKVTDTKADAILLTGDIAEAPSIEGLLIEFADYTKLPIYFVLGNHDYYFGDVKNVRSNIKKLVDENDQLFWLGDGELIDIGGETILIGHDTWADGRNGDFSRSPFRLNDSRLIGDLHHAALLSRDDLLKKMQELADNDTKQLEQILLKAIKRDPKKILIATHVPPFEEASWHLDKQSDENWQPYFSCKVLGDLLLNYANKHTNIDFWVYCGHTHTSREYQAAENLFVRVGGAEYYYPDISEVI